MKPNENTTKAEAIALASAKWWVSLEPAEVFRAQAKAPMAMPFDKFHQAAEKALGRPVWTHEFADMDSLLSELDGDTPTPDDPNQHALDSLAAIMVSRGRNPDEVIIPIVMSEDDA